MSIRNRILNILLRPKAQPASHPETRPAVEREPVGLPVMITTRMNGKRFSLYIDKPIEHEVISLTTTRNCCIINGRPMSSSDLARGWGLVSDYVG